jgi:FMN phosphatase YigB (HAD superfamily)
VIFVDWNGVLSRDPFWASIVRRRTHPLHSRLIATLGRIFDDHEAVDNWMRGTITSEDLVNRLPVTLDQRFGVRFLQRRLTEDCREMEVNSGIVALLREASSRAFIVIATDNMDCFYQEAMEARSNRHFPPSSGYALKLKHVVHGFDDILCSSVLGVLKSEKTDAFFGEWLRCHRLSFQRALLVDDSETNCRAFRSAGGAAIRVLPSDHQENFSRLRPLLATWFSSEAIDSDAACRTPYIA